MKTAVNSWQLPQAFIKLIKTGKPGLGQTLLHPSDEKTKAEKDTKLLDKSKAKTLFTITKTELGLICTNDRHYLVNIGNDLLLALHWRNLTFMWSEQSKNQIYEEE